MAKSGGGYVESLSWWKTEQAGLLPCLQISIIWMEDRTVQYTTFTTSFCCLNCLIHYGIVPIVSIDKFQNRDLAGTKWNGHTMQGQMLLFITSTNINPFPTFHLFPFWSHCLFSLLISNHQQLLLFVCFLPLITLCVNIYVPHNSSYGHHVLSFGLV